MHPFVVKLLRFFGWFFEGDDDPRTATLPLVNTTKPVQNGVTFEVEVDADRAESNSQRSNGRRRVRCVVLSDTHLSHERIDVPDGDVLIHCGDFGHCRRGSTAVTTAAFDDWLSTLPHEIKLVICGNHDNWNSNDATLMRTAFKNATYLQDEMVVVDVDEDANLILRKDDGDKRAAGLRIFGHPWTHARSFVYRANGYAASLAERRRLVAQIPRDCHIVVSHAPPYGIGDDARIRREGARRTCWVYCSDVDPARLSRPTRGVAHRRTRVACDAVRALPRCVWTRRAQRRALCQCGAGEQRACAMRNA
jgi:hypothetical protein